MSLPTGPRQSGTDRTWPVVLLIFLPDPKLVCLFSCSNGGQRIGSFDFFFLEITATMTIFWIFFLSFLFLGINYSSDFFLCLSIPFSAFNYNKFSRKFSFPWFGFQQLYIYYIPQSKKYFYKSFSWRPSFNYYFLLYLCFFSLGVPC